MMNEAYIRALKSTGEADAGQVAKAGRWAIGEIERLTTEDSRKQGVITDLCVSSGKQSDLLRDCFDHVPDHLKHKMVDLGIVDIEDAPVSDRPPTPDTADPDQGNNAD